MHSTRTPGIHDVTRRFSPLLILTLMLAMLLRGSPPVAAQPADAPVAVVSLVWGVVTIKHADADYQPARWLEPVFAGDYVKTAGPGAKLLITFFNDNHQEILGTDSEANVSLTGLTSKSGPPSQKGKPRNPFGAGGVENPFVYTHKLRAPDFAHADEGGAMQREEMYLRASNRPSTPPGFSWPAWPGATSYSLQVEAPSLNFRFKKSTDKTQYKMTLKQSNAMSKGSEYTWWVLTADNQTVVSRYPFLYLTRPMEKWLVEQRMAFAARRQHNQLQRSDYTDYLLVLAQLDRIDDVVTLTREMVAMDARNPLLYRALTRAYLAHGCPAHALQAHQQEIQFGGIDPINP